MIKVISYKKHITNTIQSDSMKQIWKWGEKWFFKKKEVFISPFIVYEFKNNFLIKIARPKINVTYDNNF